MEVSIDPLISAGANVLGNVVGGIFGASAQDSANNANRDIANQQMQFQERMSNTAYQRSMEDMRAAGLNPMLAYMKGGASTPSGATTNIQASNPMSGLSSGISAGINTAMAAAQNEADLENKGANSALTKAATITEGAKAAATITSAKESELRTKMIEAELPGAASRSNYENKKFKADMPYIDADRWMKTIQQGMGIGSSAVDMINPLKNLFGNSPKFPKVPEDFKKAMDWMNKNRNMP